MPEEDYDWLREEKQRCLRLRGSIALGEQWNDLTDAINKLDVAMVQVRVKDLKEPMEKLASFTVDITAAGKAAENAVKKAAKTAKTLTTISGYVKQVFGIATFIASL